MYKLMCSLIVLLLVFFAGCQSAYDVMDGEPRYDSQTGEQVEGRNLDNDELLEHATTMAIIKSLEAKPIITDDPSPLTDQFGRLGGIIYNTSSSKMSVVIKNAKGRTVYFTSLLGHSYIEPYLPAGEYSAVFDGGKYIHYFKVSPSVTGEVQIPYQDGTSEFLKKHWELYKK